jgi:dihydrofolate reductase
MTPLKPKIYIIAAVDLKGGLGFKGKMPWNLPGDLKHFQKITIQTEDIQLRNMVVMGRVTWESIPESHRPLTGRKNVVITRNKDFKAGDEVTVAHSIEEALKATDDRVADIFVIGGAKIYEQFMKRQKIDGIYLTRIKKEFQCDAYFPKIPKNFKAEKLGTGKEEDVSYEFLFYKK